MTNKELIQDEIDFLKNFINYFSCDIDYIMAGKLEDRIILLKSRTEKINSKKINNDK